MQGLNSILIGTSAGQHPSSDLQSRATQCQPRSSNHSERLHAVAC